MWVESTAQTETSLKLMCYRQNIYRVVRQVFVGKRQISCRWMTMLWGGVGGVYSLKMGIKK
jgi:hypothetical protein